jgi:putative membrane protein
MHSALLALTAALAISPPPASRSTVDAVALDDPTIVAIFDAANTYDIEAGQLALKTSKTKAVRDLATQFGHDHAAVRQQGRDLAKRLGVKPTPPAKNPLAADHEAAMKSLAGLTGTAFDRAYAAEEVRYHQQVIDALDRVLIPAVSNSELKDFVEKVAPAFQGHLEAARHLATELSAGES